LIQTASKNLNNNESYIHIKYILYTIYIEYRCFQKPELKFMFSTQDGQILNSDNAIDNEDVNQTWAAMQHRAVAPGVL
jgi:hypothetical protein